MNATLSINVIALFATVFLATILHQLRGIISFVLKGGGENGRQREDGGVGGGGDQPSFTTVSGEVAFVRRHLWGHPEPRTASGVPLAPSMALLSSSR